MKDNKRFVIAMTLATAVIAAASAVQPAGAKDVEKKPAIKVLMIGNSFTASVMRETPVLAKAEGLALDIVQCGIGGCPLDKHWANVEQAGKKNFKPYSVSASISSEPRSGMSSRSSRRAARARFSTPTNRMPET